MKTVILGVIILLLTVFCEPSFHYKITYLPGRAGYNPIFKQTSAGYELEYPGFKLELELYYMDYCQLELDFTVFNRSPSAKIQTKDIKIIFSKASEEIVLEKVKQIYSEKSFLFFPKHYNGTLNSGESVWLRAYVRTKGDRLNCSDRTSSDSYSNAYSSNERNQQSFYSGSTMTIRNVFYDGFEIPLVFEIN